MSVGDRQVSRPHRLEQPGNPDRAARAKAVENHFKWVAAAKAVAVSVGREDTVWRWSSAPNAASREIAITLKRLRQNSPTLPSP